ncbi:MAG: BACON domain-containing protein, partial [Prevotella sp.]|nr:BACON domain-containing protein [Prevotella sp.]
LDKGSVAPYDGNYDFGDKKVTAVSIPGPVTSGTSSPGVNGEILYSLDADDGFSNSLSCTNVIYMAEQYAEPAVNGGGPANRPYLVIGGKYNGSPDVTYYRLDFVTGTYPSQTFLPVLRNHRYRFDITEVKGPGYDTPQEAFDAVPFNMTVSLSAMNESLVTSYVYNGQYALGTSHDSYNPDNRQHTDTLYLSTTYGSYSATASSNGDWLRFGSVPGSGNASIPVTTVSNTPVMLIFNVTENDTGLQRDGTITITSGLLKKEITVIQKNTENRFLVTPANSISYTSGGTKTDFRVTSSWKWNVRIKEDPDAIITAFTSSGNTGTSLTYNFTLATSTPRYYMSATLAATLVFFSPAGEFPEEERTISIPAHAITYQPSAHRGWAGSNIYWNQSLRGGNGALTFADAPSSTKGDAPETYQGVYFMWGSLVGLDPSYSYTITDSDKKSGTLNWTDACRVYVPTWNPSDPTASSWAGTKAGSSVPVYTVWTDIPYVTDGNTTTRNDAYLTRNDATPTVGNDNKGGHVPVPGETVSPENMKGDICRYLTQTGDAPGAATGTKWRMPTSTEFANPSGTTTISDYVSWGNFNYGNSTEATNSPAGTFPVPAGRYKKYSHLSSSQQLPVAQQPLFPAAGIRADGGSLYGVGRDGDYWSSSPNAADAYRLFFHIGSASPGDNSARQYGYAVRCVKE